MTIAGFVVMALCRVGGDLQPRLGGAAGSRIVQITLWPVDERVIVCDLVTRMGLVLCNDFTQVAAKLAPLVLSGNVPLVFEPYDGTPRRPFTATESVELWNRIPVCTLLERTHTFVRGLAELETLAEFAPDHTFGIFETHRSVAECLCTGAPIACATAGAQTLGAELKAPEFAALDPGVREIVRALIKLEEAGEEAWKYQDRIAEKLADVKYLGKRPAVRNVGDAIRHRAKYRC